MKNYCRKLIVFAFTLVFSFIISGCSDLNSDADINYGKLCTVTGSINSELQNARSAFPSSFNSGLTYEVFAYQTGAEDTKIYGTVNSDLTFTISLVYGTWNFCANGKSGDTVVVSQTLQNVSLTDSSDKVSFTSFSTVSGTGTVEIPVNRSSDSSCTKLIAQWTALGGTETYTQTIDLSSASSVFNMNDDSGSFSYSEIPSGSYSVCFYVKTDAGQTLYSFWEIINVYSGLKTDEFVNTSCKYTDSNGNISIAKDLELYGSRTEFFVSSSGNDNNSGSEYAPLKTVQAAVDIIEAVSDQVSTYKITLLSDIYASADDGKYVSSDTDGTKYGKSCIILFTPKRVNIDISSKTGSTYKISAENIAQDSRDFRGILLYTGGTVSISNVIVSSFNNSSGDYSYGGGIETLDGTYSFTNVQICSNKARWGGGLCIKSNGFNVTITDCKINSNTCSITGGGVWTGSSYLKIGGASEIYENTARTGGGIYFRANAEISGTTKIYKNSANCESTTGNFGGGMCLNGGTVTVSKEVSIYENSAGVSNSQSGYGGGIAVKSENSASTVILNGTSLSGNSVYSGTSESGLGNSVYVCDTVTTNSSGSPVQYISSLKISGSSVLGDVYLGNSDFNSVTHYDSIELAGAVTAASGTNVADISFAETEGAYAEGRTVLSASDSSYISSGSSFFTVKNDSSGGSYYIDDSGILKKTEGTVYTDWSTLCTAVAAIPSGTTETTVFKLKGNMTANVTMEVACPVKLVPADGDVTITRGNNVLSNAVIKLTSDFIIEGNSTTGKFIFDGQGSSGTCQIIGCDSENSDYTVSLSYTDFNNCICSDYSVVYESTSNVTSITIDHCNFTGNRGKESGVIYNEDAELNISSSTFTNNTATDTSYAAAIYNSGEKLTLTGVTMTGNKDGNSSAADIYDDNASLKICGINSIEHLYYNITPGAIIVDSITGSSIGLMLSEINTSKKIISSNSSSDGNIGSQNTCFTILNDGNYSINTSGYLVEADYTTVSSLTAAPTSGTYSISSADELNQLSTWVADGNTLSGVTFILSSSITLSGEFTPIGNSSYAFAGTFDGNNREITGLTISSSSTECCGLFGKVNGATIKNVKLSGSVNVTGADYVGGLISSTSGVTVIDNCIVNVSVTGQYDVGGVVGFIESGSMVSITNVVNKGAVTGEANAGGIVGLFGNTGSGDSLEIYNCGNTGSVQVTSSDSYSGGIMAFATDNNTSTISIANCFNSGDITGQNGTVTSGTTSYNAIVGSSGNTCTVTNCYYLSSSAAAAVATVTVADTVVDYTSDGTNCTLSSNITVGSTTNSSLRDVMNAWCSNQSNASDYYKWVNAAGCVELSALKAGSN